MRKLKFSHSIINSPEIAKKMFEGGVEKVNAFLSELFGFDFIDKKNLRDFFVDQDTHIYKTWFVIQEREIETMFHWNGGQGDLITEELIIRENWPETVNIPACGGFEQSLDYITNYLALNLDTDIVPLDLNENNENIRLNKRDNENLTWNLEIVQEYTEGHAAIRFDYKSAPDKLHIRRFSRHTIVLD